MKLRAAIQMDPLSTINVDADSSFVLGIEALRRGYELWHYTPRDMSLLEGKLIATARKVVFSRAAPHITAGENETIDLASLDIILLRQDPPFDMAYVTSTHLLEHIHPKTLVTNDPKGVRDSPEKLLALHYPELMPPTLVSRCGAQIREFYKKHKDIILKPLYGCGGSQIFHVPPDSGNLGAFIELFEQLSREPIMAQKYIPQVRDGDKRIILIDGKPKGAVLRVPVSGDARSNLHVGGKSVACEITARDHEICYKIAPQLRARGLTFVGIDVIGDYLTEINTTSPTGLQEIAKLTGEHLEKDLWDAFEDGLKAL